jgi:PEP-CTERM motif
MKLIAIATFAAGLAFAGAACAAPNLITNGDFSAGDTGFLMGPGYTFVAPAANSEVPEGTETIADNPLSVHHFWVDLGAGADNPMLLVNGATGGGPGAVWEENNILTTVGGTYQFSADVMDICCNSTFDPNNNAQSMIMFQVSEDGGATWSNLASYTSIPGGDSTHPSGDEGVLVPLTGTFTSVSGGTFDIRAINPAMAASGNDFALDDISVTALSTTTFGGGPTPEPATWALMLLGVGMAGGALRASRKSRPLVSQTA